MERTRGNVWGEANPARRRRPPQPASGGRAGAGDRAAREDHPLLPPRRGVRHDRAGGTQHGRQRWRYDARGRARAGARGRAPAPRLLDRSGRRVQGAVRGGLLRRGPEAPVALPPNQVRVRADRARAAVRALTDIPPRGGCPWSASTWGGPTSCPSTGWPERSTTSRISPTSTAAPST